MIGSLGQDGHMEVHPTSHIGRNDGMSDVSITRVVVRCNKCGATYDDKESIELVREWAVNGYSPCPNIACHGQLEICEDKVDSLAERR